MTTLTIYSPRFDSKEDICNEGLSGQAFIDIDNQLGMNFSSMDDALDYCVDNDIAVQRIDFEWLSKDGSQMFKKFEIASEMVNTMP